MVAKNDATKTNARKSTSKIEHRLTLTNIQLQSINGQLLSAELPKDIVKFHRQNSVTLLEIKEKEVKIKLSERLYFTPEGPFRLDIEVLGNYQFKGKLAESDVVKEIEEIAHPLYSYASLVIGFITERFVTLPMIMAPYKAQEDSPEAP